MLLIGPSDFFLPQGINLGTPKIKSFVNIFGVFFVIVLKFDAEIIMLSKIAFPLWIPGQD